MTDLTKLTTEQLETLFRSGSTVAPMPLFDEIMRRLYLYEATKNESSVRKRRIKKIGGSFQHTGWVVAEFLSTTGQPRLVVEFDPPVAGMLHIYRPDQVEDAQ